MSELAEQEKELLHDWINDNWLKLRSDYGRDTVGVEIEVEGGTKMVCMNSAIALLVDPDRVVGVRPVKGDPADPSTYRYGF